MKKKIKGKEDLKKVVERVKKEGKRIVFTNGCFDLIHVGHTRYLEEAKKLGDILIVAVNSDQSVRTIKGNKRPIIPEEERAEVLSALQCVDFVVIFHEPDPLNIISLLEPDVLVKGGDWGKDAIIGREVVESAGGKVVRIPEIKGASTSSIIDKIVSRTYE
ncbi:MAG: D-glycero-beta-D-manno-heptose 1-phosphate adenylyltransferase [Thermodesulfobacteriota bacterium]